MTQAIIAHHEKNPNLYLADAGIRTVQKQGKADVHISLAQVYDASIPKLYPSLALAALLARGYWVEEKGRTIDEIQRILEEKE